MIWYLKVLKLFSGPSALPCHLANLTWVQISGSKEIVSESDSLGPDSNHNNLIITKNIHRINNPLNPNHPIKSDTLETFYDTLFIPHMFN